MNKILIGIMLMLSLGVKAQVIDTTQITTNRPIQGTIIDTNAIAGDTNKREFSVSSGAPSIMSPTAAGLTQYSKFPVGLNTGIPSINLPIATANGKKISTSVSLSYHSGGTKVSDMATYVGLGWSLIAGGAITREMKGLPDEMQNYIFKKNNTPNPTTTYEWDTYLKGYFTLCKNIKINDENSFWNANNFDNINKKVIKSGYPAFYNEINTNYYSDTEPDIFYYNVGSNSGKFVIGWDFKNNKLKAYPIPYSNINIDFDDNLNRFVVTDESGTKFVFGTNMQGDKTAIDLITTNSEFVTKYLAHLNKTYRSSWHLMEIISADNQDVIKFNYIDVAEELDDVVSETFNQPPGFCESNITYWPYCKPYYESIDFISKYYKKEVIKTTTKTYYLQNIDSYKNRIWFDIELNNRLDAKLNKGARLKSIHVYDWVDKAKCTGKVNLYHSYFNSDATQITLGEEYLHKRLKLDSLSYTNEQLEAPQPPYVFNYFTDIVPPRNSIYQDKEGFYNYDGTNTPATGYQGVNNTLIPTSPLAPPFNYSMYCFAQHFNNLRGYSIYKNPLMGLLNKIKHPTGSATVYNYEDKRYGNYFADFPTIVYDYFEYQSEDSKEVMPVFKQMTKQFICDENNTEFTNGLVDVIIDVEYSADEKYTVNQDPQYNRVDVSCLAENDVILPTNNETRYCKWDPSKGPLNVVVKVYAKNKIVVKIKYRRKYVSSPTTIPRLKNVFEIPDDSKTDTLFTTYNYDLPSHSSSAVYLTDYVFTNANIFYSNNISNKGKNAPPVMYSYVTEIYGKNGELGKKVSVFNVKPDEEVRNATIPFYIKNSYEYQCGQLLYEVLYDKNKKIKNHSQFIYNNMHEGKPRNYKIPFVIKTVYSKNEEYSNGQLVSVSETPSTYSRHWYITSYSQLVKTVNTSYDKYGKSNITTRYFYYEDTLHANPTRVETIVNNEYKLIERTKYMKDYDISKFPVFTAINQSNSMLNPVIETQLWKVEPYNPTDETANYNNTKLVSSSIQNYYQHASNMFFVDKSYYLESDEYKPLSSLNQTIEYNQATPYTSLFYNNELFKEAARFEYSTEGFLTTIRPKESTPTSFLWDKKTYSLKAKVDNAVFSHVDMGNSATMFDAESGIDNEEYNDYWSLGDKITFSETEKHTGKYSIFYGSGAGNWAVGKAVKPEDMNKKFILSAWVKVVSAGKQMGFDVKKTNVADPIEWQSINLEPTNGQWKYVQMIIDMPAIMNKKNVTAAEIEKIGLFFTYGGDVYIDDVRFMPLDAQMVSTTQTPGIGTESITGADNRPTYYEYDSFGRLKTVRDQDRKARMHHYYNIKR